MMPPTGIEPMTKGLGSLNDSLQLIDMIKILCCVNFYVPKNVWI